MYIPRIQYSLFYEGNLPIISWQKQSPALSLERYERGSTNSNPRRARETETGEVDAEIIIKRRRQAIRTASLGSKKSCGDTRSRQE